jgi:hypothetical protein
MTPTVTPAPTAVHHARFDAFLAILERLGIVALAMAPAIAAPFAPAGTGQAILTAATPVSNALAAALAAELAQPAK